MPGLRTFHDRLPRRDLRILFHSTVVNLSTWKDRLIVGTVLCMALAMVRSWFQDQSWTVAASAAGGIGCFAGLGAHRLLAARLAFHRTDGVLAADALQPTLARRYALFWHGIGMLVVAMVTAIARPTLLAFSVPAYLGGATVAAATARVFGQAQQLLFAPGARMRLLLHAPPTGMAMGILLLLSLVPAQALESTGKFAAIGLETLLFAAALTMIEFDVVRFHCSSGHPPYASSGITHERYWHSLVSRCRGAG